MIGLKEQIQTSEGFKVVIYNTITVQTYLVNFVII